MIGCMPKSPTTPNLLCGEKNRGDRAQPQKLDKAKFVDPGYLKYDWRGTMINYSTLENVTDRELFDAFMLSFQGFQITTETTYESFSQMLMERNYNPSISIGAFDSETGELVSYVLNSILVREVKTAYDILTGTIPDYRRRGIARNIFEMMKILLRENEVKLYTTEVLKSNQGALELYLSVGFTIKDEVANIITTPKGSREIYEYEISMNI